MVTLNRIKRHFTFYYKNYIYALIIALILIIMAIPIINDYNESIEPPSYEALKLSITNLYEEKPSLFMFDEDNTAILKMDVLYSRILEDNDNSYIDPIYNEDFDQCAGYIIIKKNDNNLDIDLTHMCDMLDY